MKKVLLMFAVASFLVSCGGSSETSSTTDSTQVVVDSTACDSTQCDTTKACCVDSIKVDTAAH
jgi:uncharacterized protein YcfL